MPLVSVPLLLPAKPCRYWRAIDAGYADTAMVPALGDEFISQNIIPPAQLRRLIMPEEIANAIVFLIRNPAVSGQLWADAGWHPVA